MQDNVTQADIQNAALYWVGQKDRETFPEDIAYAEANWQIIAPVKSLAEAFARHRLASTTAQSEAVQKLVDAAEDNAWREARELVRGTNADLCKTGEQAYRIIQKGITDAANNRSLRTLKGRVAAHHESQP